VNMHSAIYIFAYINIAAGALLLCGVVWYLVLYTLWRIRIRGIKMGYFWDAIREYRRNHPEDLRGEQE